MSPDFPDFPSGLVLLCIDTGRVSAEIRYENLEGGEELFPHIYGPLNLDAVTSVLDFAPGEHGTFALPEQLANVYPRQRARGS